MERASEHIHSYSKPEVPHVSLMVVEGSVVGNVQRSRNGEDTAVNIIVLLRTLHMHKCPLLRHYLFQTFQVGHTFLQAHQVEQGISSIPSAGVQEVN